MTMSEAEPDTDDGVEQEQTDLEAPDEESPGGIPGVPGRLADMLPPEMRNLMSVMQRENGIAETMLRPVYVPDDDGNPQVSQAAIVADMFNILRLDTKRIGEAAGVDIEATRMTPEGAALMLQKLVKGEDLELMDHFNHIEEQRERVLAALADEETVEEHRETKKKVSYVTRAEEAASE